MPYRSNDSDKDQKDSAPAPPVRPENPFDPKKITDYFEKGGEKPPFTRDTDGREVRKDNQQS